MNSIDKPNTPHAAEAPIEFDDAVPEHVAATTGQAAIVAERSTP